jgi:hypothetical protein
MFMDGRNHRIDHQNLSQFPAQINRDAAVYGVLGYTIFRKEG